MRGKKSHPFFFFFSFLIILLNNSFAVLHLDQPDWKKKTTGAFPNLLKNSYKTSLQCFCMDSILVMCDATDFQLIINHPRYQVKPQLVLKAQGHKFTSYVYYRSINEDAIVTLSGCVSIDICQYVNLRITASYQRFRFETDTSFGREKIIYGLWDEDPPFHVCWEVITKILTLTSNMT